MTTVNRIKIVERIGPSNTPIFVNKFWNQSAVIESAPEHKSNPYERVYGSKYQQGMDVAEIAKQVRKDIKSRYPDVKVSVRIKRFSMGQSLDATIKETPFKVINNPDSFYNDERFTKEAQDLQKGIQAIIAQYNHDGSDTQTDYFDVNFYSHVSFDWKKF